MTNHDMTSTDSIDLKIAPVLNCKWIESTFSKKECIHFIPSVKHADCCGCGKHHSQHWNAQNVQSAEKPWNSELHTKTESTDVFGTIEFLGGSQVTPSKAHYLRLADETSPQDILNLLLREWKLELPRLLISVRGGRANFELQPKLRRVFKKGLLRAASITGAWLTNNGTTVGVMKHVGEALADRSRSAKSRKVVALGIAPWGMIQNRHQLEGCSDSLKNYHAGATPIGNYVVLNPNCTHFLLVDNGTSGRYGAEVLLRKKLENFISQQKIKNPGGSRRSYGVPLICMVLEGGRNTIRLVLDCVTDSPPIPVVVCDGSGRASDLIAFVHENVQPDGTLSEVILTGLLPTIQTTFNIDSQVAESTLRELILCAKHKELITVFRLGDQELDHALLTALLTAQNAPTHDQLALTLQWDRIDIAKSFIFAKGKKFAEGSLEQAMLDALIMNRVDFVEALLKNGINMKEFLTISRLEKLYNIKPSGSTLRYLISDVRTHLPLEYQYTLLDIGMVIEHLMGGAFRSSYLTRNFKLLYCKLTGRTDQIRSMCRADTVFTPLHSLARDVIAPITGGQQEPRETFKYPFNELLIWAILMKRQGLARFMWERGEDAMVKALVACKLYAAMAHEAADDDLDIEIFHELKGYAHEFKDLALDMLDYCYKRDDDYTFTLLTYELNHWSNQTCLSLAVIARHKKFIAHPACQILLSDLWMGGLHMRKNTSLKILLGLLFPPFIVNLDFKSKEELQLQPQTAEDRVAESDEASNASHISSNDDRYLLKDGLVDGVVTIESDGSRRAVSPPRPSIFVKISEPHKSPLRFGKRIYEFYAAPITKFWLHTIAYLVFLAMFTYVVLVRMDPNYSSFFEIYVVAYIFTLAIERGREIAGSEAKRIRRKCSLFFEDMWNICDTIAICVFVFALLFRLIPSTHDVGRLFFCIDIVFWYIRILDLFSVHKHLGPYVMMVGKMLVDMLTFISILCIVLMSFGVANQAIRNPKETPSWNLLRDVFFQPYFMLYGEVFAGDIDPVCTDEDPCPTGQWVAPIIMSIYLLVANILLLNLLIAVFNNTFQRVNAISTQVWMFQRYRLITEHETMPLLPPPFIIFSYLVLLVKFVIRRQERKKTDKAHILRLILTPDDKENLQDFEEELLAEFLEVSRTQKAEGTVESIRALRETVDDMNLRIDDIKQRSLSSTFVVEKIDRRLQKMEDNFDELQRQSSDYFESLRDLLLNLKPSDQPSKPPSTESVPAKTDGSKSSRMRHYTDTSLPIISRTLSEGGGTHDYPFKRSTSKPAEYSTITDEISVRMVLDASPVHFLLDDDVLEAVAEHTDEIDASVDEGETLLEAEETEGRALGDLISKRLHQLSGGQGFDDDLAHRVADEIEHENREAGASFSVSCDPRLFQQMKNNNEQQGTDNP